MKWLEYIKIVWIFAFLLVCAIQDIGSRRLKIWTLAVGGVVTAFLVTTELIMKTETVGAVIGGIAVGVFILVLSFTTKGRIGIGDGIVMCICGALIGGTKSVACLFFGLMLTALFSMVMFAFGKIRLKSSLPFIPFLLLGTACGLTFI